MAAPTTAGSGDPSREKWIIGERLRHLLAPQAHRAPLAAGRRAGHAAPAAPQRRRLFRYDRALGHRFVAGADEAGRGCLAGPLVAAAVLFDYEQLTLADLRSLSALNDSKQHTMEMREALYPRVLRAATQVAVTSRCVRGIDERGLHKTNLAALRDMLRRVGGARAASASPTASRCPPRASSSGPWSAATRRAPRSPPPR